MTTELITNEATYLELPGMRSVEQVLQHKYRIQQIMEAVLQEGVHYGPPYEGSDKKMLLLPGAHTLTSTFGLTPKYDIEDLSDIAGRYMRYRIRARLYSRGGIYLGEGIGSCTTTEEKFQWEYALNDAHYAATDPMDRREAFKKDKRAPDGVKVVKQVRANFADKDNICLKIGKKRALVDGVILVLDCSDIFSQDLEELAEDLGIETSNGEKKECKPKPKPAPALPFGPSKGHAINDPAVPIQDLQDMIRAKLKRLEDPAREKRWDAADQAFIAAIEQELKEREKSAAHVPAGPLKPEDGAAAGSHERNEPPGPQPQQASDAPAAPPPMTDEEWDLWRYDAESQRPTLYYKAKQQVKLAKGAPIPPGKRVEFRAAFEALQGEREAAK